MSKFWWLLSLILDRIRSLRKGCEELASSNVILSLQHDAGMACSSTPGVLKTECSMYSYFTISGNLHYHSRRLSGLSNPCRLVPDKNARTKRRLWIVDWKAGYWPELKYISVSENGVLGSPLESVSLHDRTPRPLHSSSPLQPPPRYLYLPYIPHHSPQPRSPLYSILRSDIYREFMMLGSCNLSMGSRLDFNAYSCGNEWTVGME